MPHTNIDKFDEITGRIFAHLYCSFPEPFEIRTENYEEPVVTSEDEVAEVIARDYQRRFVANTVNWLIESGFISISSRTPNSFYNAVLTAKGLECLKKTPDSVSPSVGKQLNDAVRSGSIEVIKNITNQVLSVGVAIALHKIGIQQ
ncbi:MULTISPECIES: hypothetical protein [Klebsiella]|uniref:hypothetical protein n=1 Tax=Klebsiella TaxID=570 RepID=UPI00115A7A2B|nr:MULTISPECIES: hypothetical protein [Klebsiella]MDF9949100.1 hypothetical protein [Klebsiella pneumoniae]HEN5200271.1 hypothetical protein [Klebsiella pneumoniae]